MTKRRRLITDEGIDMRLPLLIVALLEALMLTWGAAATHETWLRWFFGALATSLWATILWALWVTVRLPKD